MTAYWDYPYAIDRDGRTATTSLHDHVRDLAEQVLLTAPGERVMRPDFGSGVGELVFETGGPELAATAQYLVQGALEHWLPEVIAVQSVEVELVDAAVLITVTYVVLATQATEVARISSAGGGP